MSGMRLTSRTRPRTHPGRLSEDRGSSIAEFAMVSVLLVFLLFAVLQVGMVFYVRTLVVAAASDGSRYAANAKVDSSAGGPRATQKIRRTLGSATANGVPCTGGRAVDDASGLETARVVCSGHIRSIFLPIGVLLSVQVTSDTLKEPQ
jgi:Flp pilus assembly protein TadG